jgi:hypothetical protein
VVGDRERIDLELAGALVERLHAAGLELHRGLACALSPEARSHIETAIDEMDRAIRRVRHAAVGFDTPEDSSPEL